MKWRCVAYGALAQVTEAGYSYYCTLLPSLWRWPQLLRVAVPFVLTVRPFWACNILSVNTRAHSVDTAKISVHKNGCCCCRGYRCSSVCACPSSTMRGCTSGTTSQLHSCSVRFQRQHRADWYSHRTQPAALCVYSRAGLTASRRRARTRGILPQRPICGASLRRPFANTRQARISSNGGCG